MAQFSQNTLPGEGGGQRLDLSSQSYLNLLTAELKKKNQQSQPTTKHTVNEKFIIFQAGFSIREAGDKNPQLLNNPV